LLKAHVKHLVAFVQDLVLNLVELEVFILEQVNQPAWSANQDVWFRSSDLSHYTPTDPQS
jgi:hypothetical protein